ncbi:hypothetical protein J3459_019433 [Metarhizium acridum]|nr:hypothetical protein J3459_019433 [Metarhizium acridum]
MKGDSTSSLISSAISQVNAGADYTYTHAFDGFSASLSPQKLEQVRSNPNRDAVVNISGTQEGAGWGLSRPSNKRPGSTISTYYDSAGAGTCAFVIDTGIEADHPELEGRAKFLNNFADDGDDSDGHGYGTHVSGTIGSLTYQLTALLRRPISMVSRRLMPAVLEKRISTHIDFADLGSSTWPMSAISSGVIAGMDHVAKESQNQSCPNGTVVNMSLGGPKSDAINEAAAGITKAGLFLAVAAGNSRDDAANYSPASASTDCTVGATTKTDALASYSNIGSLVKVLAPGSDILSTWIGGLTNTISGTSMAFLQVTGIGACFLGLGGNVAGLCEFVVSEGLNNLLNRIPKALLIS